MTRPTFEELRDKVRIQGKRYAEMPGTGPSGFTCKTCAFLTYTGRANPSKYPKCGKTAYTSGDATTIKTSSPACKLYEPNR